MEQAPWTRGIFFDLKYLETQIWNGVDFSGAKVPAMIVRVKGKERENGVGTSLWGTKGYFIFTLLQNAPVEGAFSC